MKCSSPAKINLFLHITGKRADGYHDLFSLMCGIDLTDSVEFDFAAPSLSVSCDHPQVPEDHTNLAHRAATLFFKTAGIPSGVTITIRKNIPVAAGLGGGSSNAATVLSALNTHFKTPFSQKALMEMGARLGADVPFFIYGRPALATGIGEILTPYTRLPQLFALLINTGINVSTAAVYKSLKLRLTNQKKGNTIHPFTKETCFKAETHLANDLEAVTAARYPEINDAKQRLREQGAKGVLMSGSGPTVFGLFSDRTVAENAEKALKKNNKDWFFLAKLLTGDDET